MKFAEENRGILSDHGFEFVSSERQQSKFVADFQMLGYHNRATGMHIMISFFPEWENQPSNIYPILTDHKGRKLPVEDFLKKHSRADLAGQLTRGGGCTDTFEFLHAAYSALRTIMSTELRGIVSGNEWETVLFDWAGLR